MGSLHRFFGVEFTGHRNNVPVPYVKQIEGLDGNYSKTGYEYGCQKVLPGSNKNVLSEEDLALPLNMQGRYGSLSYNESPLFQAFENGVLLNDAYASRFIEDFIAGFEYALQVQNQLTAAKTASIAAFHNARYYGFEAVALADFSEQVRAALGEGLINFKVLPISASTAGDTPEPGDDKFVAMNIDDILANIHTISFDPEQPLTFVGEANSYELDMQRLERNLEEKPFVRSFLLAIVNHIAGCIENVMFERYRADQVNKVIAKLKEQDGRFTIVKNIYLDKQ